MATLETMCKLIAKRSNGKWTVKKLLKWSEGRNSMESTLRISEIVGTYEALLCAGEKFERVPLSFKPKPQAAPLDVTDEKEIERRGLTWALGFRK